MKYSYKLLKKKYGTKTIEDVAIPQFSSPVSDMLYMPGWGMAYLTDGKIKLFDDCSNKILESNVESEFNEDDDDMPIFKSVAGIGGLISQNVIFVAENGGRSVKMWDKDQKNILDITRGQPNAKLNKALKKTKLKEKIYITPINLHEYFIAIPSLRKIFHFKDSSLSHYAGDGYCRFANGLNPSHSSIGCPSGMTFYNGSLLVSDSFKHIIRTIKGNKMDILWGHPKQKILCSPSKLVVQQDSLYVQCADGVKTYSFSRQSGGDKHTYKSNSIVSIASGSNKDLYILTENTNA